jgi:hypothetical protein
MLTTRATLPLLAFAFMVAVSMPTTLAKGEACYPAKGPPGSPDDSPLPLPRASFLGNRFTALLTLCAGERSLKTWPVTNNYAHLLNGASVHMPQSTYYGRFLCSTSAPSGVVDC